MITLLITLIVYILVAGVICFVIGKIATATGIPVWIVQCIYAIVGLIIILAILDLFGIYHFSR